MFELCVFSVQWLSVSLMCPISLLKTLVAMMFAGNTHTHTQTHMGIAGNL